MAGGTGGLTNYQVAAGNTSYNSIGACLLQDQGTEANAQYTFQRAGTLSGLSIRIPTNSLSGTLTLTSRLNTAAGGQTVSVTTGQTGWFTDSSNSDTIAAGDEVGTKTSVAAGSGTADITVISSNFAATTGHATVHIGHQRDNGYGTDSATTYHPVMCDDQDIGTEANVQLKARAAGTIKDLEYYVSVNPRTTTCTVRSRVNGANGNQTVSITSTATGWFHDSSNSDTIADGDLYNLSLSTSTGGGTIQWEASGVTFVSSATNNDLHTNGNTGGIDTSGTTYYIPLGGVTYLSTTEANVQLDHNFAGTASKLRVYIDANTMVGATSFRFRKNAGNGNQVASITALTTGIFEDASNTDSFAATDDCCYSLAGGTAGSITWKWGQMTEAGPTITVLALSESLVNSIIEIFSRLWTAPRSQSESVSLQSEGTTRTWSLSRGLPIDVLTITESINSFKGRVIEIMETLGITETFSRTVSWTRTFSENSGIIEAVTRVFVRTISLVESIVITETISIVRNLSIVISNFVSIIEHVRFPLNWLKRTKPTTTWTPRTKP